MTDDECIKNTLSGDTDAFRHIIRSYSDMSFSLAVSIVKDPQHAEDICQNSFIKAFNGLSTFKGKSKLSTWLYRIVVNESFRYQKKQSNWKAHGNGDNYEQIVQTNDSGTVSDYKFDIHDALASLSPNESLALTLFYLEENNIKEVSEITGWTSSNTKVIMHRARKNLRKLLNGESLQ